jgi:hypothetical protein
MAIAIEARRGRGNWAYDGLFDENEGGIASVAAND